MQGVGRGTTLTWTELGLTPATVYRGSRMEVAPADAARIRIHEGRATAYQNTLQEGH